MPENRATTRMRQQAGTWLLLLASCGMGCGRTQVKLGLPALVRLAEEQYPGRLVVIDESAEGRLSGGDPRFYVTFAVRDDPNAIVTILARWWDGHLDCEFRSPYDELACAEKLDEAVRTGLEKAEYLRVLLATFDACGYPILGYKPSYGDRDGHEYIWVPVPFADRSLGRVTEELDVCMQRWESARGASDHPEAGKSTTFRIGLVDADSVGALPVVGGALPRPLQLADPERIRVLHAAQRFTSGELIAVAGRWESTATHLRLKPPWEWDSLVYPITVEEFLQEPKGPTPLERRIQQWLAAHHPELALSTTEYVDGGLQLPRYQVAAGTSDRLVHYFILCDAPSDSVMCMGDHLLIATTDFDGIPVEPFALHRDMRGRGEDVFPLPGLVCDGAHH